MSRSFDELQRHCIEKWEAAKNLAKAAGVLAACKRATQLLREKGLTIMRNASALERLRILKLRWDLLSEDDNTVRNILARTDPRRRTTKLLDERARRLAESAKNMVGRFAQEWCVKVEKSDAATLAKSRYGTAIRPKITQISTVLMNPAREAQMASEARLTRLWSCEKI